MKIKKRVTSFLNVGNCKMTYFFLTQQVSLTNVSKITGRMTHASETDDKVSLSKFWRREK